MDNDTKQQPTGTVDNGSTPQADNNSAGKQDGGQSGKTDIKTLPADVQAYIESLKDEAIKNRKKANSFEEAAKKAEEKRLTDLQDWKTLAEQRATQLAELEAIREQAESIQEAFNATLESRLKVIPQQIRQTLIDPIRAKMSPAEFAKWLEANESNLNIKRAPNMDAGAGQGGNGSGMLVRLTPEQRQIAQAMRMTDEQYAKQLVAMQEKKNTGQ